MHTRLTSGTGRCLPNNLSQCACAAADSPFAYRRLQTLSCAGLKSKDCAAPCAWVKGSCVDPVASPPTPNPTSPPVTSQPTNPPMTSSPVTSSPTKAPATSSPTAPLVCGCSDTALPTTAPTKAPVTPNPTRQPTTSAPTQPCIEQDTPCDQSTTCIENSSDCCSECCNGTGDFYGGRKGLKYCAV